MKSITVYCSASTQVDVWYHKQAEAVGREIGTRGCELVFGGGSVGLMNSVAKSAKAAGGTVTGIITSCLMGLEKGWRECDELIVAGTMRERKRLLESRGDAFLILPGGVGTYEEFFEILVGRKLGEHTKPIGIMNCHRYFEPLFALINHGIAHGFVDASIWKLFEIGIGPSDILDRILAGRPGAVEIDAARGTESSAIADLDGTITSRLSMVPSGEGGNVSV